MWVSKFLGKLALAALLPGSLVLPAHADVFTPFTFIFDETATVPSGSTADFV